ncbi:MAG TPA: NAD-dependent epimerase/dehydratase family protein [Chitinophagales bacterium]|nr:NAD-dependent epimerase/dehydratase family protein [Chitinophagales bacterium]
MKIRAIITGATGMVGEGVMHECLQSDDVEEVLIINRRPSGYNHPKLKEIIHENFFHLSAIEQQLKGYNACYFCLGVSSVGMSKDDYYKFTYELTLNFAQTVLKYNKEMTFCYVSGSGTDSSEKSNLNWARVKGKTENEILRMGFKQAYMFRPGFILPTPGLKNTLGGYKYLGWLFPVLKVIAPGTACTLKEIGDAMINVTKKNFGKKILEVKNIKEAARMFAE